VRIAGIIDFGMMTGFMVEIVIIPFYMVLIPFEPQFCPKSKSGVLLDLIDVIGSNALNQTVV
jgi:hypothetical protein